MRLSTVVLLCLVGVACAEEFLVRCKRPICDPEIKCDYYQRDDKGCDECKCIEDPCKKSPCAEDEACFADEEETCVEKGPCKKLLARCVKIHHVDHDEVEKPVCPLATCRMKCDYGFKKNDLGCHMCQCDNPCDGHECGDQENCHVIEVQEKYQAKCKARPLCHRVHDIFVNRQNEGMMAEPKCTHQGEFEPLQCHQVSGECWCVDDQGIEIPTTRGMHQPQCHPHHCHHAHVGFDVKHNMDSVHSELDKLQSEMSRQLSTVMTIEQDNIDQLIVSPNGVDLIHVEFDVIRTPTSEGVTLTAVDVATTVYHLKMKIKKGDVLIVYGENELAPIPETWKAQHNYEDGLMGEPLLPADGPLREMPEGTWSGRCVGVYRRHRVAFMAAAIGTLLSVLFMIYVVAATLRRKRVIRKQKEKQMRTYKENLAFSNQLYDKMVLPTNEDVEEKKPLDDEHPITVSVA